ncbi:hypothetical protein VTK73DRAFT_432 [Phialemonium thermophilum]|uniref:Uncharacterized protein n=1 Tax=Phialemonium thermophilum TaxID=223376 RepID=A0ABR3VV49_9PEZI
MPQRETRRAINPAISSGPSYRAYGAHFPAVSMRKRDGERPVSVSLPVPSGHVGDSRPSEGTRASVNETIAANVWHSRSRHDMVSRRERQGRTETLSHRDCPPDPEHARSLGRPTAPESRDRPLPKQEPCAPQPAPIPPGPTTTRPTTPRPTTPRPTTPRPTTPQPKRRRICLVRKASTKPPAGESSVAYIVADTPEQALPAAPGPKDAQPVPSASAASYDDYIPTHTPIPEVADSTWWRGLLQDLELDAYELKRRLSKLKRELSTAGRGLVLVFEEPSAQQRGNTPPTDGRRLMSPYDLHS